MSTNNPEPRWKRAAFGVGMKHFVWGGDDGSAAGIPTTHIQTFDVSSTKWKEPQRLQGSLPDGLRDMAVTTDGECAYLFGGWNGSTCINTIYEINSRTLECKEILSASSFSPPALSGSRIVYQNNKLVVQGGYTDDGRYNDDLYIFDKRSGERLSSCLSA